MNGTQNTNMPRSKKKRRKEDNITMRGIKVKNSKILICPQCARRYIQTEINQEKCLFCVKNIDSFHSYAHLQYDPESDIITKE